MNETQAGTQERLSGEDLNRSLGKFSFPVSIFTGLCNKFLSETSLGSEEHEKGDTELRWGGKEDAQRDWQETSDVEAQTHSNEVPHHSDHI